MRLTGPTADAALAFLRDGRTPAPPRPAATVILLRDDPLQVYLLRRHAQMAFAAGMSVFPGGRVDTSDASLTDAWSGPPPAKLAEQLGCETKMAVAYAAAAVRETFEESGVLLAGPTEAALVTDTTGPDWAADRVALEQRQLSFADFLHRRGLVLRADLLGAWAHWITPDYEPLRYDTRFFVAALPPGQITQDVSGESDQVTWLRPAEAVADVDAKRRAMMPPTYRCCVELTSHETAEQVLSAAQERTLTPIQPWLREAGDEVFLEIP